MSDIFSDLRDRVAAGGEEPSDLSKREALLVLDAAYQAAKERDDWKSAHAEVETRATAYATARDDFEGRAVRAERRAAELEATLVQLQQATASVGAG